MALNARYGAVATATTAASTSADKVAALIGGLFDAIVDNITETTGITPGQQNKIAVARAHCLTEKASFVTALGL